MREVIRQLFEEQAKLCSGYPRKLHQYGGKLTGSKDCNLGVLLEGLHGGQAEGSLEGRKETRGREEGRKAERV